MGIWKGKVSVLKALHPPADTHGPNAALWESAVGDPGWGQAARQGVGQIQNTARFSAFGEGQLERREGDARRRLPKCEVVWQWGAQGRSGGGALYSG